MPRGRRLLYARLLSAWAPAALLLLIAVSPAVHTQDALHRSAREHSASIRDVDASLTALSAGVVERVASPGVWPMQVVAGGVAALALLSWLVPAFAAVLVLRRVGLSPRDRAPPRALLVHA